MAIRETLEQAGYVKIESLGEGEYLLTDSEGNTEIWFKNNGHASYGIRYADMDLEFARSIDLDCGKYS